MKRAILFAGLVGSFTLVPIQACANVDGKFSLETGMDYNTGKYGASQSTDILYVPVTARYQGREWTLKLTVPYLQISGPANVVVINGAGLTGVATTNTRSTRSGLGDVLVAATHNAYNGGPAGLVVNLTGKIKFGTASSANGLGTGKNDYTVQSDMFKVSGNLTTFGTLGYRVYGSPAAYTLRNVFFGALGVSYKFDQATSGGVMLTGGQKVTATGSSRQEVLLFASHKLERNWKTQGYLLKGFTNSVPDWGVGATVAYLF